MVTTTTTTEFEWIESLLDAAKQDLDIAPETIGGGDLGLLTRSWLFFRDMADALRFVVYLNELGIDHDYVRGTRIVPVKVPEAARRRRLTPSSMPPRPDSKERITERPTST